MATWDGDGMCWGSNWSFGIRVFGVLVVKGERWVGGED